MQMSTIGQPGGTTGLIEKPIWPCDYMDAIYLLFIDDFGHTMKVSLQIYVHYKNFTWTLWRSRRSNREVSIPTMLMGKMILATGGFIEGAPTVVCHFVGFRSHLTLDG
jgi:hypothetical protein